VLPSQYAIRNLKSREQCARNSLLNPDHSCTVFHLYLQRIGYPSTSTHKEWLKLKPLYLSIMKPLINLIKNSTCTYRESVTVLPLPTRNGLNLLSHTPALVVAIVQCYFELCSFTIIENIRSFEQISYRSHVLRANI